MHAKTDTIPTISDKNIEIPEIVEKQLRYSDLVVVRPSPAQMTVNQLIDLIEKRVNNASTVSAYLEYTNMSGALEG